MDYKIKLGSVLRFDYEQERDIIEQIESLTSRHKLGEFISNLIRISFDNPKIMESHGLKLGEFGVSEERYEYFKEIESEMLKMRNKVDRIYDMTLEMYTMAKFGKRLGLEEKSKNLVQSQFLLQRQIEELSDTFGVSNIGHTFESNKIGSIDDRARKILEYILISYDDVVSEVRSNINHAREIQYVNGTGNEIKHSMDTDKESIYDKNESEAKTESNILNDRSTISKTDEESMRKDSYNIKDKDKINAEDEVIDFGQKADWNALSLFVGEKL